MEISINLKSPISLDIQIVNQIRFAIAAGRLRPGDELVAVAPLAEQLRISRSATYKAYRDLQVLGLVRIRPKRDVTVTEKAPSLARRACREYVTKCLFQLVQEGKSTGMTGRELTSIFRASAAVDVFPYADLPRAVAELAGFSGLAKQAPDELDRP